jgi:polyisoprenyl-teichoic acid--peptidoglycan teichoic acid transferase
LDKEGDSKMDEWNKEDRSNKPDMTEQQRSKEKRMAGTTKKALLIIAAVIILLLVITGSYVFAFFNQVREPQRILLDDVVFEEKYNVSEEFSEHILNIGLLGFDRGWNRENLGQYLFRPDMQAVISINFDTNQIAVVRIPRDSYVPIHGTGGFHDKINHSYYYGYIRKSEDNHNEGIQNTLKTMSYVLGDIPIHYYISVDMYSIVELVDAFGGIYYEVEETIYDHHWNVGAVLVPEGPQIMDGKTYLRFLQYRDDKTNQDYGRIDRQMDLLKHTFIYLKEKGKITDIPATYRIYKDYVETDLSYTQIAALAYYARDFSIDDDHLKFFTIQGDGQMKDGIWYQVIFQRDRLNIIKEVFNLDVAPWPPIVLEDSPEYLEEQRLKKLEEEGLIIENPFDDDQEETEDEESESGTDSTGVILVPDLTGLAIDAAKARLESAGLKVGAIEERYYNFMENGHVVFSAPLPGNSVYAGTAVDLVVSLGPETAD